MNAFLKHKRKMLIKKAIISYSYDCGPVAWCKMRMSVAWLGACGCPEFSALRRKPIPIEMIKVLSY